MMTNNIFNEKILKSIKEKVFMVRITFKDLSDEKMIQMATAYAYEFLGYVAYAIAITDMRYSKKGTIKDIPDDYRDSLPWIEMSTDRKVLKWWIKNYGEEILMIELK